MTSHGRYQADGAFVGIAKFSTKMEKYFSDKSVEIFQTNELNSYMEKVLDNGVLSGDLKLDYFDSTCFKTIEVDFSEDLIIAKTLFSNEK